MLRVDLAVPFDDRDSARRLGARWDHQRRVWFVPENRDPSPFARWLPEPGDLNVRAATFFIATATTACLRCRGASKAYGFALPVGHETLYVDDESGEMSWETSDEPTFVCYLSFVTPRPIERMRGFTGNYRIAYRRRSRSYYWANFCEHCGSKLGDYDVFCEPGDGFMPLTREQAARIVLAPIDAPFVATAGGWSLGVELFEFMTLAA